MRELAKDVQKEITSIIPFQKVKKKTKGTLELIHFDVCGPMPSISLSGYEYYVTFIEDYSRRHVYIS